MVTTPAFKNVVQALSGRTDLSVLGPRKYNDKVAAYYARFCKQVASLLRAEQDKLFGLKFLNLLHDA